MKPIDITLLAVTAGVAFMAFTMSRKAGATTTDRGPFGNWLANPQEHNQNSYWRQYLMPNYLETQAAKELTWAVQNPAPSNGWTVG